MKHFMLFLVLLLTFTYSMAQDSLNELQIRNYVKVVEQHQISYLKRSIITDTIISSDGYKMVVEIDVFTDFNTKELFMAYITSHINGASVCEKFYFKYGRLVYAHIYSKLENKTLELYVTDYKYPVFYVDNVKRYLHPEIQRTIKQQISRDIELMERLFSH